MRPRDALYLLSVVLLAAWLIWPGYQGPGASARPFLLGLPFSFVWVIAGIAISFVSLAVYDRTRPGRGGDDGDDP